MSDDVATVARGPRLRLVQGAIALLIFIVFAFAVARAVVDLPHLTAGTVPEDGYARPYVAHPWLAYLHITPGVLYLLGAPLQLSYRFRSRHYDFHRRLGRVLLSCALLSGVFAIVFGARFAFGGVGESAATLVFGLWFLTCLLLAFRAIRGDDVVQHRRWMIRAFAMGIAVGTIRIWVVVFDSTGLFEFQDSFDVAFWLSFLIHAAVAELWVRTTPHPPG
ncbi:MAG: DUF2306 domain-containing protein [Nocardioidaceae bacterium]